MFYQSAELRQESSRTELSGANIQQEMGFVKGFALKNLTRNVKLLNVREERGLGRLRSLDR